MAFIATKLPKNALYRGKNPYVGGKTMMKRLRLTPMALTLSLAAAALVAFGFASSARADTFDSTFSQSNVLPAVTPQDWGALDVSCTSGTCTVSLTPHNGSTFFGNGFLSFNLNTTNTPTASVGTLSSGGNVDGLGSFTYQISLHDGPSSGFSSATTVFTVTYAGTAASLLVANSSGFDAAGHVLFNSTLVSGCTGFVGEPGGSSPGTENGSPTNCTPVSSVPEPSSAALLLVGVVLIGGTLLLRRRETDDLAI